MPQRRNLHRQIMLDEDEPDPREAESCHEDPIEALIVRFLRAVRRIGHKTGAPWPR